MISTDIYPDHTVHRYDLVTGPVTDRSEQELKARRHYLNLAYEGDASAILLLKTHWHLKRLVKDGREIF